MNKTANCVSSSVDFLDWYRGGIPGWVCLVLESGWFRIVLSYPSLIAGCLPSLYRLFSACCRCRFSPPYLCRRGPPNSSLAVYWPQYWRSFFFLCPLSAPLLFKQVLRSTPLAGLPFRFGLGRVMDAIGYSPGLLAPFASCP